MEDTLNTRFTKSLYYKMVVVVVVFAYFFSGVRTFVAKYLHG